MYQLLFAPPNTSLLSDQNQRRPSDVSTGLTTNLYGLHIRLFTNFFYTIYQRVKFFLHQNIVIYALLILWYYRHVIQSSGCKLVQRYWISNGVDPAPTVDQRVFTCMVQLLALLALSIWYKTAQLGEIWHAINVLIVHRMKMREYQKALSERGGNFKRDSNIRLWPIFQRG